MTVWPILVLIVLGASLMILERVVPARSLPHVPGWWFRVILINLMQVGVVVLGGVTWDLWLKNYSVFNLSGLHPLAGAFLAYFIITFVFYWWHKWRHDLNLFWLLCHQIHHSPQRIETITSFYKHPVEILLNSLLIGLVVYVLLGLSVEAGAWVTVITGVAEFFYHMNIRTPYWLGFIVQRPESHRVHHQRGKHYNNFADLPLWDMIFGTFRNPKDSKIECGFLTVRELQFSQMLIFKNVNGPMPKNEK